MHWRTICWVLCSQPVLMCGVVACIKESPYWLVQKGRKVRILVTKKYVNGVSFFFRRRQVAPCSGIVERNLT